MWWLLACAAAHPSPQAQAVDASAATSTPEGLPATRRIEFALHSGWGNMNQELLNAVNAARLLGRQLVVPHVMKHFDLGGGGGCHTQSDQSLIYRAEHIVHEYAHHVRSGTRPTLDSFFTLYSH